MEINTEDEEIIRHTEQIKLQMYRKEHIRNGSANGKHIYRSRGEI